MTGLGSAAVVKARLGGFAKAKMHFTALQYLLAERGGLHTAQNLSMRETTILMIAFMGMIGLEDCPFRTMVELETAKREFIDAFKILRGGMKQILQNKSLWKTRQTSAKPLCLVWQRIPSAFSTGSLLFVVASFLPSRLYAHMLPKYLRQLT
jgi:hypothetical protein